ncbi:MAG: phosphoadenosine phosphosulfate reductase domain-containing protein [Candidatus Hodarchaeales archaeon]
MNRTPIPYLGKIRFYWCNSCRLPLIASHCSMCGKTGRRVQISPPGDVRPAMSGDVERMISVIEKQFGSLAADRFQNLVSQQIIFLNKVPYIDRMDEIIVQGEVIGIFRYNIIKTSFEILPKISLASLLWSENSLSYVKIDSGAKQPVLKGASVLAPGVLDADENISIDDPVIVVCDDEVIAVGLAKMLGRSMVDESRGVAVKTKYRKKNKFDLLQPVSFSWADVIKANEEAFESKEKEAINFIENSSKDFAKHVVAYSGGKDSLVTLDLVAQSDVTYEIIFSDTNLEYPETLENIRKISHVYQRKVHTFKNESWDFWERFQQFGPPTRNSRWCCKSAKLFPVNELLESLFPEEEHILTFLGRRRYESFGRSKEQKISQNPWIPKQVSAAPIQNWNAFEVFLYIHKHKITHLLNPLYSRGFIRIGCWVCPASSMSDFEIMKETHPELLGKLNSNLEVIRTNTNLPDQFVTWGLWRWKKLPQKVFDYLKKYKIKYVSEPSTISKVSTLKFKIASSASPCVKGGYSSFLMADQILDLAKIQDLLPILGFTEYNDEMDVLSFTYRKNTRVDIFRDGSIVVKGNSEKSVERVISLLPRTIYRAVYCDGCGICTFQCKEEALHLVDGHIHVKKEKCILCLQCNSYCPLIRYRQDKEFIA